MPKIMESNNMLEMIEREIANLMLQEDFQNEKNNVLSAGGPMDKSELKLAQFDIAAAFNNSILMSQKDTQNQNTTGDDDTDFRQNSETMRHNSFFQKFLSKHEESVEIAIERLEERTAS